MECGLSDYGIWVQSIDQPCGFGGDELSKFRKSCFMTILRPQSVRFDTHAEIHPGRLPVVWKSEFYYNDLFDLNLFELHTLGISEL